MGDFGENPTREKMCRRARGTHDLDTVQHALSVVGSSHRWSMMRSSISGGREGDMIAVFVKTVRRWLPSCFRLKMRPVGAQRSQRPDPSQASIWTGLGQQNA